ALHARRFGVDVAELPLGNVGVVALQFLLGLQLRAEVGELLLPPLAMLAGTIFALVHGALRAAPDVFAHTTIDLVFRSAALAHVHPYRFVVPPCGDTVSAETRPSSASGETRSRQGLAERAKSGFSENPTGACRAGKRPRRER